MRDINISVALWSPLPTPRASSQSLLRLPGSSRHRKLMGRCLYHALWICLLSIHCLSVPPSLDVPRQPHAPAPGWAGLACLFPSPPC